MATGVSGIAILGWGSLLWEPHAAFDDTHGQWLRSGPALSLEFSRISRSRLDALTLVIDSKNGRKTIVSYCISNRKNLDDAICDLRCREGTPLTNIGFIERSTGRRNCDDKELFAVLSAWLERENIRENIDAVVWTNLKSNFDHKHHKPFSISEAIYHLQSLSPEAKVKAAEYVWRAPKFVHTHLRYKLETKPWFQRVGN